MGWEALRNALAPSRQAGMGSAINAARSNSSSAAARIEQAASASGVLPAADSVCPNLTFKQRVWGCVYCSGTGMALSFLGFLLWWTHHIAGFATTYTLGNIVSLCSTGFLFGPKRQCRSMFAANRIHATGIYLGAMLLTLIVAFARGPTPIVLALIFIQW